MVRTRRLLAAVLVGLTLLNGLQSSGCRRGGDPAARTVAEWVLEKKGTVTLAGSDLRIRSAEQLPDGTFRLDSIDLASVPLRNQDLEILQQLGSLNQLVLYQTGIGDQGLDHIAHLRLRDLELSYNRITDEGLAKLAGLRSLQKLFIRGTAVSDDGVAQLRRSLRKTTIYH